MQHNSSCRRGWQRKRRWKGHTGHTESLPVSGALVSSHNTTTTHLYFWDVPHSYICKNVVLLTSRKRVVCLQSSPTYMYCLSIVGSKNIIFLLCHNIRTSEINGLPLKLLIRLEYSLLLDQLVVELSARQLTEMWPRVTGGVTAGNGLRSLNVAGNQPENRHSHWWRPV